MSEPSQHWRVRDWVALILALGVGVGLILITFSALWIAVTESVPAGGLSENATQVISGIAGGIIGILGAYLGYQAADKKHERNSESE